LQDVNQAKTQPNKSYEETNLQGNEVRREESSNQVIEEADGLNEDGTKLVKKVYKWYMSEATYTDKQNSN